MYTLSGFEGRPTMDLDFMLQRQPNDAEKLRKIIEEICKSYTGNDYIVFEVKGSREITPDKEYPGAGKRRIITRLPDFKAPNILTYSMESAMAEKFDAILKRMTATSRMKDFYDIYYWSQMYVFDGRTLREAVYMTLHHRGTLYDRDSMKKIIGFQKNEFLLNLWDRYNPGPGLAKPDFGIVLKQIETFIGPVYEAILNENALFMKWSASENRWL